MQPPKRKKSSVVVEKPETPTNPFGLGVLSDRSYKLVSCSSSESEVPHVLLQKKPSVYSDDSDQEEEE